MQPQQDEGLGFWWYVFGWIMQVFAWGETDVEGSTATAVPVMTPSDILQN